MRAHRLGFTISEGECQVTIQVHADSFENAEKYLREDAIKLGDALLLWANNPKSTVYRVPLGCELPRVWVDGKDIS
jgi:hypothetical protein